METGKTRAKEGFLGGNIVHLLTTLCQKLCSALCTQVSVMLYLSVHHAFSTGMRKWLLLSQIPKWQDRVETCFV